MNETDVITVRFWAAARAAAGTATEEIALSSPVTLADLHAEVVRRHSPPLARVVAICSVLVDEQQVGTSDPASVVLPAGAVVDYLPPFAGG